MRLPLHFAAVCFPVAVVGHGSGAVFDGLGDEETVEWVAVMRGESGEAIEISRGDREQSEVVFDFQVSGEVFE
jgi:hypothetical protein